MAQSTGSIVDPEIKIKFTFKKVNNEVKVFRYCIENDANWILIPERYQSSEHHVELLANSSVQSALSLCERQRTLVINLTEEEALPYLSKDFAEDDDTDIANPSVVSNVSGTDMMVMFQQMMRIQEEAMKNIITSFQASVRTNTPKRDRIEIAKFDCKNEDARCWMVSFERGCEINEWITDRSKINHLKACLDGMALKWYNARVIEEHADVWSDWKSSFLRAFGQNRIQLATQANNWQYRSGSLLEYYYEKQRLLQLAFRNLTDYDFITMVMMGLPDDFQSQLLTMKIDNKEELRNALEKLKPVKPKPKAFENSTKKFEKKEVPSKKIDYQKKSNESALAIEEEDDEECCSAIEVISDKPTAIFNVKINESNISALLDTGSTVNLIRRDKVSELKLEEESKDRVLHAFDGKKSNYKSSVKCQLSFKGKKSICEAIVVEDLKYPLIIGIKTLSALMLQWNFHENEVFSVSEAKVFNLQDALRLYPDAFGEIPSEPTFTVSFSLKPDAQVVQCKPYRLSNDRLQWSKKEIQKLLEKNLIRVSSSEYASPSVLVSKGDSYRMCQDYRLVNLETQLDPYPFPLIDEIINAFGGCTYFSKIDLKDGFRQIGLSEESRKYTAFVLPSGHFEHNRLPFGWKNSPSVFQRTMVSVLGDLLDQGVFVYIDDVCCGARSLDECARLTAKVLEKLSSVKLKINLEKSEFCQPKITFLGRVIDGFTKTTKMESVEKVINMRAPRNQHEIKSFTGLTGHFRQFIANYAAIVKPLDKLKRKNVPFDWSEDCQKSFDTLKKMISANPVLQSPDFKLPFEISADASHDGCGAVLYQRDVQQKKDRQLRVIGYFSYNFNKHELNYSITEKEALAVIRAIKYFRSFVEGRDFVVHTDHQALSYLMKLREPKGRLARWQIFLSSYNLTISHRPGKEQSDADSLSRLAITDVNQIDEHRIEDSCYALCDNRKWIEEDKINKVLADYHDSPQSGGHDGQYRTYLKIKARFKFNNMKSRIFNYVRNCPICQVNKFKYGTKNNDAVEAIHSTIPFETWHLDFAEVSKKKEGNATTKSFLVMVDEATRITQAKAMKESSRAVIEYLQQQPFIEKVRTLVSDNGAAFRSKQFADWADANNIQLRFTAPYHPASNGMAERRVREVKRFLKCYMVNERCWKTLVEAAYKHINRSFCSAIGCTPYFKAFGRSPKLDMDTDYGIEPIQENMFAPRKRHVQSTCKQIKLQPGSEVLVATGPKGKEQVITGPFKIQKVKELNNVQTSIVYVDNRGKDCIAHMSNVRPYYRAASD